MLTPTQTSETLAAIREISDIWASSKSDSLIDYVRSTRVEPITLIDAAAMHLDILPEVQQSLLTIFTGYYLQAVAISTNIGRIDIIRKLDKLNPNRSVIDNAGDGIGKAAWFMSVEAYADKLPNLTAQKDAEIQKIVADQNTGSTIKDINNVKESVNLSVGKLISVDITDGTNKATIPVAVRLMANSVPSENLIHILSIGSKDNSMKERFHGWRSGRLSFIKDLVMCQDLIDAHKKNLKADKSGIYAGILSTSKKNTLSGILSGNPSVATSSNIIVLTKETANGLEREINGKLKDFKTRESIFAETYVMILAVIDPEWDRVTFYHRGINSSTEVSARDLKASNKGSGPDVSDILKAYSLGNSPGL